MPDDDPAAGRPFLMIGLLGLDFKKGKPWNRGKLTGGRWVTDDGHHLYIRRGKVIVGRGIQAGADWHEKPKPKPGGGGGGGGDGGGATAPTKPAAKPAATAKPMEVPRPVAKPVTPGPPPAAKPGPPKPAATKPVPDRADPRPPTGPNPGQTALPGKPVVNPAKSIGPVPDRYANAFDPKFRVTKPSADANASAGSNVKLAIADKSKAKTYTDVNRKDSPAQQKAMHAAAERNFGDWEKGLTKDERNSIDHYAGLTGYQIVNGQLRSGQSHTVVPHIDAAIAKGEFKESTTLYRGFTNASRLGLKPGPGAVGTQIKPEGYHSTSLSAHVAGGFADTPDSAILRIRAPKGTKAAHVGTLGDKESEHEFLLPRGTGYKVTGYKHENGKHVYDVELI